MRREAKYGLLVLILLAGASFSCCRKVVQPVTNAVTEPAVISPVTEGLWKEVNPTEIPVSGKQIPLPAQFKVYRLDTRMMRTALKGSLKDTEGKGPKYSLLELPVPEGGLTKYNITETSTLSPDLLARFPQLRTYGGKGIDDPTAVAKLDFMPSGFHAYMMTVKGSVIIHPFSENDTVNYICYYKQYSSEVKQPFELPVDSTQQHK